VKENLLVFVGRVILIILYCPLNIKLPTNKPSEPEIMQIHVHICITEDSEAGDFKAGDFKAEDFRAYIINLTRVEVGGEAVKSYKFPLLKHKTDIEPDSCPNKSKLFQKATHVTR
jgi:hypothetical protein